MYTFHKNLIAVRMNYTPMYLISAEMHHGNILKVLWTESLSFATSVRLRETSRDIKLITNSIAS